MRYRWKLTNFTTGEKNRAQNCLTVSNIKLDDVFSDVFGKAATAITTRLLEKPSEKIVDVSGFRTKGMKATDAQVLAALDGEICPEQAEKLRIIRSRINCKKCTIFGWVSPCFHSKMKVIRWHCCLLLINTKQTREIGHLS